MHSALLCRGTLRKKDFYQMKKKTFGPQIKTSKINAELREATKAYIMEYIPKKAVELNDNFCLFLDKAEYSDKTVIDFSLSRALHQSGINMRYIGMVYSIVRPFNHMLGDYIIVEVREIYFDLSFFLTHRLKGDSQNFQEQDKKVDERDAYRSEGYNRGSLQVADGDRT